MPSQGFLLCFVQRSNEAHGAPNDVGTAATGKSGVDGCLLNLKCYEGNGTLQRGLLNVWHSYCMAECARCVASRRQLPCGKWRNDKYTELRIGWSIRAVLVGYTLTGRQALF